MNDAGETGVSRVTTNIFMNAYQQPENKLTYCFLTLIEHLSNGVALQLLSGAGLHHEPVEDIAVSLLYGGGEGNPDGSVTLIHGDDRTMLFFENKTWRRGLDIEQIAKHLRSWIGANVITYLLVITSERRDRNVIARLNDPRILFMTWHDVLEFTSKAEPETDKDFFMLRQFAEYLEMSEEAWRASMISPDLLTAHSTYLAVC
jgi:hypothetical protein